MAADVMKRASIVICARSPDKDTGRLHLLKVHQEG
eukprot:COSAG05_NODE_18777_length_303_cov_0.754902_1_plen_34_part_10